MSKVQVPPAPQPSFSLGASQSDTPRASRPDGFKPDAAQRNVPASKQPSPLDAAFLSRTFLTLLWFGVLLSILTYAATRSVPVLLSFVLGLAVGALLLKSQEMFVRLALPRQEMTPSPGLNKLLPLAIFLPLKYAVVLGALAALCAYHLMQPIPFGAGFGAVQFVLVARLAGFFLARRMRSIHEVYVQPNQNQQ